jgi:hypothetical protein
MPKPRISQTKEERECSVKDCHEYHYARGLCYKHYIKIHCYKAYQKAILRFRHREDYPEKRMLYDIAYLLSKEK